MTKAQAIAVALTEACGADLNTELSERDITLIAWKRFPELFGIRGNTAYPDTKMVSIALANRSGSGIRHYGWLVKSKPGRWRLTQEGVLEATRLKEIHDQTH